MKIFILVFLFVLNIFATEVSINNSVNDNSDKVEEEKIEFIQVSNIPESASITIVELKEIKEATKSNKEIKDMISSINPYVDTITKLLFAKDYKNIENSNSRKLQKMRNELVIYKKQLQEWEIVLKKRIKLYDIHRKKLKSYHEIWAISYENAIKEKAPKSIKKHIKQVISSIEKLNTDLKKKYDKVLTNSQVVTTKSLLIQEKYELFKDRESVLKNNIFYQNEDPYFKLLKSSNFSFKKYTNSILLVLNDKYDEILGYIQSHIDNLVKLLSLFTLASFFIIYTAYLYKIKKLFIKEDSYNKKEFFFIKHIFSTISIAFVLITLMVYSSKPASFKELLVIIMIIPVITILKIVVERKYYKYLYIFFTLFLFHYIDSNSNNCYLEHRTLLIFINLSLISYIAYILINKKELESLIGPYSKLFKVITISFIIVLLFVLLANFYGSVLLSARILDAIINLIYASFLFYVFYMILTAYTIIILRKRISGTFYTIKKYSENIEKTTKFFIKIWMVLWWLLVVAKLIGFHEYLIYLKNMILSTSWEVGEIIISVQSVVDFATILLITWIFSKLIKIFLEVEIFARFKFPRGMPTAILTTLNYLIIITGTILAFSSLGVTTQQFALVIGALGVGIGFGLRNIIANFVSGIIMVFERPVQIGDTIEVNKTMGDVQSIGARSSTVKTFDGAEVIIPNADFIAKEIINWTLSDKQRRKTIEFKVSLDNDLDEILAIMNDVALSHKDVVLDPKPVPTFQGFGEYYLTFKLYFWLSDNIIEAQSEIAIDLYKKLKDAGINLPIPKTELKRK